MKILVTGATGLIGCAVARTLLRAGHDVVALVRHPARAQALGGARLAVGEMERPETYVPLVAEVDAVVHAAQMKSSGRWTRGRIRVMHQTDALMTRGLALACLEQKKHLIYTSGAMVHATRDDQWIDEQSPARPCLLARGHAEMVAELTQLRQRQGLRVSIITPGMVYGSQGLLRETIDLLRRKQYRVFGDGLNWWSFVHVDDVAEAYLLALTRGEQGGDYFLADDRPLRRRQAIDLVCDALKLRRVGGAPSWIVKLMIGSPLVEAATSSIRMRNARAKEQLDWSPQFATLADGLPATIEEIG